MYSNTLKRDIPETKEMRDAVRAIMQKLAEKGIIFCIRPDGTISNFPSVPTGSGPVTLTK